MVTAHWTCTAMVSKWLPVTYTVLESSKYLWRCAVHWCVEQQVGSSTLREEQKGKMSPLAGKVEDNQWNVLWFAWLGHLHLTLTSFLHLLVIKAVELSGIGVQAECCICGEDIDHSHSMWGDGQLVCAEMYTQTAWQGICSSLMFLRTCTNAICYLQWPPVKVPKWFWGGYTFV